MYIVENHFKDYIRELSLKIFLSKNIGLELKNIRRQLGLTQKDVAEFMNLRRETISRIENGGINPTFDYIKRFVIFIALVKIFRDISALEEMGVYLSPNVLRVSFNISIADLEKASELGMKTYQKHREKTIKKVRVWT